jgi:transcriptional regulator with PAS, ATPase and Fis domain
MKVQEVKQRFGIIGTQPALDRALYKAIQVAATDISVLVTGESGVGKENIPKIIHHLSHRKHAPLVAVNCGAIPEGTIDSELFGHEKGAFTGAAGARKGYFEEADGGTIFLDEVGELPLGTQVRLLRVLETGEFIKVGSSKAQKIDVRVVGATNVDMLDKIEKGQFREDLFYRLNTVEISLPPLRERKDDIHLLFRKFAQDFSQKYRVPAVRLSEEAVASSATWSSSFAWWRAIAKFSRRCCASTFQRLTAAAFRPGVTTFCRIPSSIPSAKSCIRCSLTCATTSTTSSRLSRA